MAEKKPEKEPDFQRDFFVQASKEAEGSSEAIAPATVNSEQNRQL